MARIANTKEEYRTLFAKTGNQCAFPDCNHPLIDEDDEFIAQVCHIEAAGVKGERYNSNMDDEDRRSINNLIVLCHRHHVKTNNTKLYTVARLKKMKAEHEGQWGERLYQLPDQALDLISEEQLLFAEEISRLNLEWQKYFDLAMKLEFSDDPTNHLGGVAEAISRIEKLLDDVGGFLGELPESIDKFFVELGYDMAAYREVPYYKNPFHNAFWEMMNIGVPNFMSLIIFHSKALEVHIEIQKLKTQPSDELIRKNLDKLKLELTKLASTLAHVD